MERKRGKKDGGLENPEEVMSTVLVRIPPRHGRPASYRPAFIPDQVLRNEIEQTECHHEWKGIEESPVDPEFIACMGCSISVANFLKTKIGFNQYPDSYYKTNFNIDISKIEGIKRGPRA